MVRNRGVQAASAALTLIVFAWFLAPLGPAGLLSFLLPVPVAVLFVRQGPRSALAALTAAAVVTGLLGGAFLGLGLFVAALVAGFTFGQGLRTNQDPVGTVLGASGLLILAVLTFLLVAGLAASHGQDPLYAVRQVESLVDRSLAAMRRQLVAAYMANGLSRHAARAAAAGLVGSLRTNLVPVLPAFTVLAIVGNVTLAYILTRLLLRDLVLPPVTPFALWHVPVWVPPLFLLATIALMLGHVVRAGLAVLSENVFFLSGAALAVQGLSVLYYALQRLRAGRTLSLLALLVAILLPVSMALLAWFGVADSLTDFRRIHRREGR
jgi:uncharacterized protein YybS (DUF2232 family)